MPTTIVETARQMAQEAREILKPKCLHLPSAFICHYAQTEGSDVETRHGQCTHCKAWVIQETWLLSGAVTTRLMTDKEQDRLASIEDTYRWMDQ